MDHMNYAAEKIRKIRNWMNERQISSLFIRSRVNYAWLTTGGESMVTRNTSLGDGLVVVTADHLYLIAHSMDLQRLVDEQSFDTPFEPVLMRWYEGDLEARAFALAEKGQIAADYDVTGTINVFSELVDLHWPLNPLEVERTIALAEAMDAILYETAQQIGPGMSEIEAAAVLRKLEIDRQIEADTLMVGAHSRNLKYRHPLPTEARLSDAVLLHSAARKWGLHVNLTRTACFGEPPGELRTIFDASSTIQAGIINLLRPGLKFAEILTFQKQQYAELGYPDEWKLHFQGGPLGYVIVDARRCESGKTVTVNMPFEWFVTITGTKTAELPLLTDQGVIIPSLKSAWPLKSFPAEGGSRDLPDILIR